MPKASKRIAQLVMKQFRGTLTEEEKVELDAWIKASPGNEKFMQTRMRPDLIAARLQTLSTLDKEGIKKNIWRKIREIQKQETEARTNASADTQVPRNNLGSKIVPISISRLRKWGYGFAAASVATVLVIIALNSKANREYSRSRPADTEHHLTKMRKKASDPKLHLEKNQVVHLDSMPESGYVMVGSWRVIKESVRHISYRLDTTIAGPTIPDSPYNTLSIPKDTVGWQVSLPSGSRVVLAPSSSLRFRLTGKPEVVLLEGEATFDVHPDSNFPFLVETSRGEVSAHGTLFTVKDFQEEKQATVSLFSGRLDVNNGRNIKTLQPAQMATILSSNPNMQIGSAPDILEKLPWRPDVFDFSRERLRQAMRRLAAWYGMKYVNIHQGVDTATVGKLSGHVRKDLSLPDALKVLQTDDLHFDLNEKEKTIDITR